MSALWHGFYPGYYLTFLSCALFQEVARLLRRHLRPLIPLHISAAAFLYHCSSTMLVRCREVEVAGTVRELLGRGEVASAGCGVES